MRSNLPSVEIAVPVYNEERCLESNVFLLADYLAGNVGFPWTITIADNASTDGTPQIGARIAAKDRRIIYKRISRKGRGYALKEVFMQSGSDIVCYMDVDLSTKIVYLKGLIGKIADGCDIAVGSRLMAGSKTKRGLFRELLSRSYNFLIKAMFFSRFSDAQCGFKAMTAPAVKKLIPEIRDNRWFFDTELLLLAERRGFKIGDVPVEWVDDPDSKVNVVATVAQDLSGLLRMKIKFMLERRAVNRGFKYPKS